MSNDELLTLCDRLEELRSKSNIADDDFLVEDDYERRESFVRTCGHQHSGDRRGAHMQASRDCEFIEEILRSAMDLIDAARQKVELEDINRRDRQGYYDNSKAMSEQMYKERQSRDLIAAGLKARIAALEAEVERLVSENALQSAAINGLRLPKVPWGEM